MLRKQVLGVNDIQGSRKFDGKLVSELTFTSNIENTCHIPSPSTCAMLKLGWDNPMAVLTSTVTSSVVCYISNSDHESGRTFFIQHVAPCDLYLDLCCPSSDSSLESSSRKFQDGL